MRLAIAVVALSCCCCLEELEVGSGPAGDDVEFLVEVPRPPRLDADCTGLDTLSASHAVMHIGGHVDCVLDIDPTTLGVSGTCERITIGIIRPLMIAYYLSGDPPIHWAFRVGWVDLSLDAVQSGNDDAVMLSAAEGSYGLLLLTDEDVYALPEEHGQGDIADDAAVWARGTVLDNAWTLDHDNDGCPNIEEACAGTLYDDLIQDC